MKKAWTYVVASYDGADRLPLDVTSFESDDLRRFTRSFVGEFEPKLSPSQFQDVLVRLITKYDTDLFATMNGEVYSCRLEWNGK